MPTEASLGPPRGTWLAVLGACALILAPTLGYRMGLDQGVFAYLGAELLEGRWPYLETWDHSFPGLAFLQSLEIALLGRSIAAFRLFDFCVTLASAALIFRIGWWLGARAGAGLGACTFALIYQGYGAWNTAQREGFGLCLLLLGFWGFLTWGRRRPALTAAGVGLAFGAAVAIKPTLAMFALAYAPLLRRPRVPVLLAGGFAAALPAAVFVVLYAVRGGLPDLFEACIAFQTEVYVDRLQDLGWVDRLSRLGLQSWGIAIVCAPFVLRGRDPQRSARAMLYLGYLAVVAAVAMGGTFAGYHYLPGLGIGAILLGNVYAQVVEGFARGRSVRFAGVRVEAAWGLVVAAVLAALPIYVDGASLQRLVTGQFLADPAPGEFRISTDAGTVFDFTEDFELAEYLRQRTRPSDRIQVWGHESLVYYLAERDAASRFQTSNPLVTLPADGVLTPMQSRWRAEFLRDLEARPPRYVVVTRNDHWWWAPGERSSEQLLDDFPEWKAWIRERTRLEGEVGRFLVYRVESEE